jgi:short subunit fatty acids transporter
MSQASVMTSAGALDRMQSGADEKRRILETAALLVAAWAERWFPDTFSFAVLALSFVVMQAANDLKVHLGWAVQAYNAAGALPNLINPFWMVPLLGIIRLKARDLVGFTLTQLVLLGPLVLLLLWALAPTLPYHAPTMP